MADVERTLLSKALQSGELPEVIARGVDPDHFVDPLVREVYEYANNFMRQYNGDPPTIQIVKAEFPSFKPVIDKAPLGYHLDKFIDKCKERESINILRDLADAIDDPDEVRQIELKFFEAARNLTDLIPAPRSLRFSDKKRYDDYHERKKTGDIRGILMGIPSIDKWLLGLKPGQLMTIVAYTGVGKSILMCYIAYSAYLQGKTSLMISLEMSAEEVMQRIDVMASKVRSWALMALELDIGEEERWYKILERADAEKHERDILVRDDIQDCTADHVFAEVSRIKPDLVFVDYLELMAVPRSQTGRFAQGWEKVNAAGAALKQNARILRIPHVTAAQLNREGKDKVTLATVGHQSIGKHSDVMLGLQQDEDQEDQQEMEILSLKVRNGRKPKAEMRWALDTMDIHEKGVGERFPNLNKLRKGKVSQDDKENYAELEIRRAIGGKANPWTAKAGAKQKRNPWTARVKAAA